MFIRCNRCHGSVWVESEKSDAGVVPATCNTCDQHYEVKGATGRAGRDLASAARKLAMEQQIDLPGAHSVLLGMIDLASLREVLRSSGAETHGVRGTAENVTFDPGFKEAVRLGLLTPRQACERGDRSIHATTLSKRHGLSMEVAHAVTDNRTSLLEALRTRKPSSETPVVVGDKPKKFLWTGWAAAALVIIAIAAGIQHAVVGGGPLRTDIKQLGGAEVSTDKQGRVLLVRGPDPRTVLRTFCVAGERPFIEVATVPATLYGARTRLGLLRDPYDVTTLLAIPIREDDASKTWVAGDGARPLVATRAPLGVVEAMDAQSRQPRERREAGQGTPGARDP